MKLAIMQPYFFPYLGYFSLVARSDTFVLFDTPQYIRRGWVNRNRILHPQQGWQYITVPVRQHRQTTPIFDMRPTASAWRESILGQLSHYRRRAPFYDAVLPVITSCLNGEDSLARLNGRCLREVCQYIGIFFEERYWSQLAGKTMNVSKPGDWALKIAERLGAQSYLNPLGGAAIFDPAAFAAAGIELEFLRFAAPEYSCRGIPWQPDLSILDVLMWNPPERIREWLKTCSTVESASSVKAVR